MLLLQTQCEAIAVKLRNCRLEREFRMRALPLNRENHCARRCKVAERSAPKSPWRLATKASSATRVPIYCCIIEKFPARSSRFKGQQQARTSAILRPSGNTTALGDITRCISPEECCNLFRVSGGENLRINGAQFVAPSH